MGMEFSVSKRLGIFLMSKEHPDGPFLSQRVNSLVLKVSLCF